MRALILATLVVLNATAGLANDNIMPIVTPAERAAARERSRGNDGLVEYELRTRLERRLEAPVRNGDPVMYLPGSDAAEPDAARRDFGAHWRVPDPTTGMFPRHVKLRMLFMKADGDSSWGGCSGTLISPRHVITAGHCAYTFTDAPDSQPRGPWAASIIVYPGWDGGIGPAGTATVTGVRTWPGWIDDADYDHDIALLTLDRPLGGLVGWQGVNATDSWSWFDNSTWDMYAYPAGRWSDAYNLGGDTMYHQTGNYDYDDYPQVGADRESYRGTSGGGAIKNGAVWAVRSHGSNPWADDWDTYDTAITPDKLTTLADWMDQDRPDGSDLTPLDVQVGAMAGAAGDAVPGFSFVLLNQGESDHSSGVSYTVYIGTSDVTNINADTYVTSGSVPGTLAAGGSVRVNVPGVVIPPGLDEGNYFLGVFINTVDGSFANNMTREQDTTPYFVICPAAQVPVLAFPENGHPCVPTDLTLNWGSVPGVGVQYELQLYRRHSGEALELTTGSTQHTFYGLREASKYDWRVRAITDCGGASNWSTSFTFTTEGPMDPVAQLAPDPGARCVDPNAQLSWNAMPGAGMYRVRLENFTQPGVQIFDTPMNTLDPGMLTPGDHYEWKVKARNECLVWNEYSETWSFYVKDDTAADAEPIAPPDNGFTGPDPVLACTVTAGVLAYEYELRIENAEVIQVYSGEPNWQVEGLTEGPYEWRSRALSCTTGGEQYGAWSDWAGFQVDTTPPVITTPPVANSHAVAVWDDDEDVVVEWFAASDNWSGVAEYWLLLDQSPDTVPVRQTYAVVPGIGVFAAQEGTENWFHMVAVDASGNVSTAAHIGPFHVDTGPPTAPVLSANLTPLIAANVDSIVVSWPASIDPGSGVAGYSYLWTTDVNAMPLNVANTTELSVTLNPAPEGNRWFRIRSVDQVGNAGPVVEARYFVDRTAPAFNQEPELNPAGGIANGDQVQVDFHINDNFGFNNLHSLHYYSVDGGSFWYEALCDDPWNQNCGAPLLPGSTVPTGPNVGGSNTTFYWTAPYTPPGSQVLYKVVARDEARNTFEWVSLPFTVMQSTGAGPVPAIREVALHGAAPNPFNPQTTISYSLPGQTQVSLVVFDLAGRRVATLVNEIQTGPARYEVKWGGLDENGQRVSSGVYLCQLRAGDTVETIRMALVK